jgi:ribosomal protein L7/L12/outer membrane protein assembly factor BamB
VIVPIDLRIEPDKFPEAAVTPTWNNQPTELQSFLEQFVNLDPLIQPEQIEKLRQIKEYIVAGQKIQAIKVYREVFDVGLKEAKEAIETLMQGRSIIYTRVFADRGLEGTVPLDQIEAQLHGLIREGRKIEAIKLYRQSYDVGLKESKDIIEALERGEALSNIQFLSSMRPLVTQDEIRTREKTISHGQPNSVGCLGPGLLILILISIFVPLFFALTQPTGLLFEPWARINPFAPATLDLSFGGEGNAPGLFQDPRHVAVDSQGNIFIGEYSSGQVQVFNEEGEFITLWSLPGDNPVLYGMAVDHQGRMYAIVSQHLYVLNAFTGQVFTEWKPPEDGWGSDHLAVGSDQRVIVSWGLGTDNILRYMPDGSLDLWLKAAIGSTEGGSVSEVKVAVDRLGEIYALSTTSSVIYRFDSQGKLIGRFGGRGEEKGQFETPYILAVDRKSRIYVSDFKGIQVFDSDGRYLYKVTRNSFVYGMAFDEQNRLYTVDAGKRIYRYDLIR